MTIPAVVWWYVFVESVLNSLALVAVLADPEERRTVPAALYTALTVIGWLIVFMCDVGGLGL